MSGDLKQLSSRSKLVIAVLVVAVAVLLRWLPHPPNFAPITAIAIFGGAVLGRKSGLVLPITAIVISDLLIGLHSTIFWTWGAFAAIALISRFKLSEKLKVSGLLGTSIWASVFFFLVSNFGVWLQGGLYPLTSVGLSQSYINGLPFFWNTLMGDMFYTALIFSAYFVVIKFWQSVHLRLFQLPR